MNSQSKRFFLLVIIFGIASIGICLGALWSFNASANALAPTLLTGVKNNFVIINQATIQISVARTSAEQEKGLSGRASLPTDTGLFFVFNSSDKWGIWMKDMNFPIDVIWISADKKVNYIVENMDPSSYPKVYTPTQKAQFILEVPAGTVRQHAIKIGDDVTIQ